MSGWHRLGIVAIVAAGLGVVPIAYSSASTSTASSGSSQSSGAVGKQLYREFCGQCHALDQALAAGFGSDNGLGQYGGPSFNNLRVPYDLSIVAVTEGFAGHEQVVSKITWQQLDEVAAYLAAATKNNPYLARVTDG